MATVLVVDDDELVGKMLVRRVKGFIGEGHHVLYASSMQEAHRMVRENEDIVSVICDTEMPDGDGTKLHARVHELIRVRGGVFIPLSAGKPQWAVDYYALHGMEIRYKLEFADTMNQLRALIPKSE